MPSLQQQLEESLSQQYRIERELGEGGMAIVFAAIDLKHEREVAVKVLRPGSTMKSRATRHPAVIFHTWPPCATQPMCPTRR